MSVTRRTHAQKRSYQNMSVKAGVLAGATYPEDEYRDNRTGEMIKDARGGLPVASIAAALEFGDHQRVARPFMHHAVYDNERAWVKALRTLLRQGVSAPGAFAAVGQIMKEDIQHVISTWPADNSDEWAAIKGFSHGLIQTSHLLNSIDFEISGGANQE